MNRVNQMRCAFAVAALIVSACGKDTTAPAPVASVSISPSTATLQVGQTQQLTAATLSSSGTALTGRAVTWSSSDASIASVSTSGLVTAVHTGTTTITASSEGKSGAATIAVPLPVPTTVTVQFSKGTIQTSDSTTATATVLDQFGQAMTGQTVTWRSSDTTIASVSAAGVVFGETSGTLTITATVAGKSGSNAIVVQKSFRYKKWLAIKALGDSLRAARIRAGTFGSAGEIDLDADGDLDLYSFENQGAGEQAGEFRLFRNLGDTAFVAVPTGIRTIVGSNVLAITDVNGDGRDDLFAPSFGLDAPPFPGTRQRLYLQNDAGTLIDRGDLMPSRTLIGHAGCYSKARNQAMVVGGTTSMLMKWNGQRFDESLAIVPSVNYADRPSDWNSTGERASYMSYWVCAFFDADGDGVPDVILGSGNSKGLDTTQCCGPSKDMYSNRIGASHAILWGPAGSDTLRYQYPSSVVPSGADSLVPLRKIDYIQNVVADFDSDGCKDVAFIGTDYSRNELVDIIKGCVPRGQKRVVVTYRWDIQGSFGGDVNWVNGVELWHPHAAAVDVNGDGIKDLALINDNCFVTECDGNIGMQVRIGINDGTGHFSWRRAVNSDFWAMPLRAQIFKGWTWNPRAR